MSCQAGSGRHRRSHPQQRRLRRPAAGRPSSGSSDTRPGAAGTGLSAISLAAPSAISLAAARAISSAASTWISYPASSQCRLPSQRGQTVPGDRAQARGRRTPWHARRQPVRAAHPEPSRRHVALRRRPPRRADQQPRRARAPAPGVLAQGLRWQPEQAREPLRGQPRLVIQTCRKRGQRVLAFLTSSIQAALRGAMPPLLPPAT